LEHPVTTTISLGPDNSNTEVQFKPEYSDNEKATFSIVAKDRHGNPLSKGGHAFNVGVASPSGSKVQPQVTDNHDGTYNVEFEPTDAGEYEVTVNRKGKPVHDSPFRVDIKEGADAEFSELERVQVVNCAVTVKAYNKKGERKTASGDHVDISVTGPEGDLDIKVVDNYDGTYTVKYQATPGEYKVKALINGKNVKGSPFTHNVHPF